MSEEKTFEVDLIVRAHGHPDTVISREYVSSKASTDGAAGELWDGLSADRKAMMRPVNDGK